ncbi:putative Leucine-rich repeat-containing G-protein coupled receptor 5 [Hypsibius exemplaris]|uniref:Leucine-rich repeat-containing G-protein coupled receptor 5 n=1 Tax=Hypsibius exemplaris TaxID=2072580 RepID=A0A1W0WT63_HYPEX|nr:putative Leucine-rich repeat-containing G-protein coupled receptor 5 [Hypsibius exemplaris]
MLHTKLLAVALTWLSLSPHWTEGKCSRLPSGYCWVNCLQEIFDVICNGVTSEMIRTDIGVFTDTPQQLRLYIWSSPAITRLSADVFRLVRTQLLTIDLQDVTSLDTFPELQNVVNLQRLTIWNSPRLYTLPLELLPQGLNRLELNMVGISHFDNDFGNLVTLPNVTMFSIRNITLRYWQKNFLDTFPKISRLEISDCRVDITEASLGGKAVAKVQTITSLRLYHNVFFPETRINSIKFFGTLIESLVVRAGATVDIGMNDLTVTDDGLERIRGFKGSRQFQMPGNALVAQRNKIDSMLDGYDYLEELDMSRTKLVAVRGMFSRLPRLRKLKLDHNNLQNISTVDIFENSYATNLSHLDLAYNEIEFLPPSDTLVRIAPQVTHLNLEGNRLRFLSNTSARLESQLATMSAFSNLLTLIISSNGLSEFNGIYLSNLVSLQVLDVSCNPITQLSRETFLGLPQQLVDIDLSMCIQPPKVAPWIEMDAFTTLPAITKLRLNSGSYKKWIFRTMKFSAAVTKSLQELYLEDNLISYLQEDSIPNLPNLQVLSLNRNFLQSIGQRIFTRVPNLKRLYLRSNRIGTISQDTFSMSSGQLQKLQHLDLSDNGLYQISPGAFDALPSLMSLMIGFNPTEVQNIFETGGKNLTYLGIQGYNRSCLSPQFFAALPVLRWVLPDVYNLVLVNPDDLSKADPALNSLLQVCQYGVDEPDHEPYPAQPGLKNYVSVTIHDTDAGTQVEYPMIAAFLPLNYCPVDDYVNKLGNTICTTAETMDQ